MTVQLAYWSAGHPDAPPLVLGSSLGTTHGMWAPQVPALAERFRVIAFDHRGHGGSPGPPGPYTIAELGADVLALLDQLGVGAFRYAGLSLGGMIGMWLAAREPERVTRLAVLCSSARLGPAQGWRDRAAAVRAGGSGAVADAVVARWFTSGFARRRPDVVACHRAMLATVAAEGYAGCCEAIAEMDLRGALAGVQAPTLVIAGADDPATPPEHGERIASAVPGAALAVVPDAAHLANVEQPEAVARYLGGHLA